LSVTLRMARWMRELLRVMIGLGMKDECGATGDSISN
jgi:hypothetical protein